MCFTEEQTEHFPSDVGQVIQACRKQTKTPVCLTSPLLSGTHAASISGSGSPDMAVGVKDNLERREPFKQHMEAKTESASFLMGNRCAFASHIQAFFSSVF